MSGNDDVPIDPRTGLPKYGPAFDSIGYHPYDSETLAKARGSRSQQQSQLNPPGLSNSIESLGQYSTLFDKFVCNFAEQEKVKEFRKYMVQTKITNFICKLYQYAHANFKKGLYIPNMIQEFLNTYPGESDPIIDEMIESRVMLRKKNLIITAELGKADSIFKFVNDLYPEVDEHGNLIVKEQAFEDDWTKVGMKSPNKGEDGMGMTMEESLNAAVAGGDAAGTAAADGAPPADGENPDGAAAPPPKPKRHFKHPQTLDEVACRIMEVECNTVQVRKMREKFQFPTRIAPVGDGEEQDPGNRVVASEFVFESPKKFIRFLEALDAVLFEDARKAELLQEIFNNLQEMILMEEGAGEGGDAPSP